MVRGSLPQVSIEEIELGDVHADDRIARFVVNEVCSRIPASSCLISIDGFDGVGKSTLAYHLANNLNLPLIHLDDYLISKQGCYLEAIKLAELSCVVDQASKSHGRSIVEGCSIENVLNRINKRADFKIYVMRTNRMRSRLDLEWVVEEEILYSDKPIEELLSNEEKQSRAGTELLKIFGNDFSDDDGKLPNLRRELIQYHFERRPHESADLIVKIVHIT